jgi:hypothetical protein
MRTMRFNAMLGLGLAVAAFAVVSPRPVRAQSGGQAQAAAARSDGLWSPWLGCWKAEGAPSDAGLLCVRPGTDENSVEVLQMKGSDVESREVVWADGQHHETSRNGCDGWEQGAFSKDGQRLFLSSRHTCQGGVVRTGGGIMAMVSPTEWLDVRYIGMSDNQTPWVQRYRLASEEQSDAAGMSGITANRDWTVRAARMSAANPPDVDDVIEASKAEPAPVVQAWLAERKAPIKLDAKALERMADAGVDPSVTDMAVAVSYPSHFQVNTEAPTEAEGVRAASPYGYANSCFDPFWDMYGLPFGYMCGRYGYSPFAYGYSPYAYSPYGYSPYGYSPYGYGYGGYYGGGYFGGYTPVITITNRTPVQHGRVIAGHGYTRSGYSGTTGSAGASSAPARSSGSSSAGSSSSSGSSSSGRTAHRRGGGGGGR